MCSGPEPAGHALRTESRKCEGDCASCPPAPPPVPGTGPRASHHPGKWLPAQVFPDLPGQTLRRLWGRASGGPDPGEATPLLDVQKPRPLGSFLNKLGLTGGQQSQGQSGPGAGPETRVWSGFFLSVGKVSSPPCGFAVPGPSASQPGLSLSDLPGVLRRGRPCRHVPPAAQVLPERGSAGAGAGAGAGSLRRGWNSSKYRCHAANYRQRRSKLRNDGLNKFLDFLFTPTATWVRRVGERALHVEPHLPPPPSGAEQTGEQAGNCILLPGSRWGPFYPPRTARLRTLKSQPVPAAPRPCQAPRELCGLSSAWGGTGSGAATEGVGRGGRRLIRAAGKTRLRAGPASPGLLRDVDRREQ